MGQVWIFFKSLISAKTVIKINGDYLIQCSGSTAKTRKPWTWTTTALLKPRRPRPWTNRLLSKPRRPRPWTNRLLSKSRRPRALTAETMDVHGQKFMDKSMANPRKFGPKFSILQICLHPTVFVVGKKPSWRSISNFPSGIGKM